MFNPFQSPDFIRFGYDDDGYYVSVVNVRGNVRLQLSEDPTVAAAFFKANGVQHYDLSEDLLEHPTELEAWLSAAMKANVA